MISMYLKMTLRNLRKNIKFSVINILGLAIGLCCFLLIMLWVQDELSFDRFHKNADHIYLVLRSETDKLSAVTTQLLAPALKEEFPEVVDATSYIQLPESIKLNLKHDETSFDESFGMIDPEFFNMFSFPFLAGDPQSAFSDPNSIIITENVAKKYFSNKNALGESFEISILGQTRTLKISGVLKNIPQNSHFTQNIFIPILWVKKTFNLDTWDMWTNRQARTYILTQPGINIPTLEQKLIGLERSKLPNQSLENLKFSLFPLKKIHLYSGNIEFFASTGDIKYVYILTIIGAFLLLIACVNYINLSNALSLKRLKEIGIQKVVGAHRSTLVKQHFGETLLITFVALGIALVIAQLFLPILNLMAGKTLFLNFSNPHFFLFLVLIVIITSLISGMYSAIYISGFNPIQIIKGKLNTDNGGFNLRKGLIIFQFTLSLVIIICTLIVFRQLYYIKNSKLGYDKENIICIKIKSDINSRYEAFRNELLTSTNIINVTRSEPMDLNSLGTTEGLFWPGRTQDQYLSIWLLHSDSDFASTYKLEMQEGRFYSREFPSDETGAFVLNQAAVEAMGVTSPLGMDITLWNRSGKIIGICKDFHFGSLHHKIEPLVIRIPDDGEKNLYFRELSIRIKPNTINQSMAFIKNEWKAFFPESQFDYYFLDDYLNTNYNIEQRMGEIFKYFSLLAIFIAALGLYGLTAFTIEQKTKDIGIYKVFGASVTSIAFLFSKNYFVWIIIANIIAWPVTWFAMNKWLQNFSYRVDISIWPFLLAGMATLVIGMVSVSLQVMHAAMTNPVDAFKCE